jgi:hypothetical protein
MKLITLAVRQQRFMLIQGAPDPPPDGPNLTIAMQTTRTSISVANDG